MRWNDVKGSAQDAVEKRKELLLELRNIRHKISKACRENSLSLSETDDLRLVAAINDALVEIIGAVPNTFTALARSAQRFEKRAVAQQA
jgi:hypothetical protein